MSFQTDPPPAASARPPGDPLTSAGALLRAARGAADRPDRLQAAYNGIGGLWPLLSYRSFEAVTGQKREPWLVKTVGLLMLVTAHSLRSGHPDGRAEQRIGIGSALAFALVDVWYGGIRRRISPIYLLDAVIQAGFLVLWTRHAARGVRQTT